MSRKKTLFVVFIILFSVLTYLPSSNSHVESKYYDLKSGCIEPSIDQLSFAAFSDTHIGAKYQYFFRIPRFAMAEHLDRIGEDLIENTNLLDFAVHLGDIVNHNTAQVNGLGLPEIVNQYKNNLKEYLISNVNLPFHCVIGNHDINDYEMNEDDPHNLTKSLIDELSMNNPVHAMMREGILFLVIPELGYAQWTHPILYEWIEYMTNQYKESTTIILCHQAIEDTTFEDLNEPYRGKQDMDWWANLFQVNPQIKMWIHGHNHLLDWYFGNQSSGYSYPIRYFGHEMAFSAPYSQLDWGNYHEEDRIVIYNITSSSISTSTWENNGNDGYWVPEYINSWNVSTSYNQNAKNWYSFPMFLQDNETQLTDMKLLSPNITLQLIGTKPMELFYDAKMESPSGWSNETILGFGNDTFNNVKWNKPGMKVYGPTILTFPEKFPYNYLLNHSIFSNFLKKVINRYPNFIIILKRIKEFLHNTNQEDGRSGQPYQCFPMGTICTAVPGQTYNFTIVGKSKIPNGKIKLDVSCCDWGTKSQYSVLNGSKSQVLSHTFNSSYETIYGSYTVPKNKNAWFLQGSLSFLDENEYEISLFSIKRDKCSNTTDNFHLLLSNKWYNISNTLKEDESFNFTIDPQYLCDEEGIINFTAFIDGNRYGMVNIIYREPLLLGRNARFKIQNISNKVLNISLVKKISRSSNVFKMIPFSTDPIYSNIDIIAEDESGKVNYGRNGNLWLSCNCPEENPLNVKIILLY